MNAEGFSDWLEQEKELKASSRMSVLSKCSKIESCEGNLDEMYEADKLESLLARLTFTAEDKRAGRQPLHNVEFSGDPYTNTRVLKSAARAYRDYKASLVSSPLFGTSPGQADIEQLQRHLLWKGRFLERYAKELWSLYKDPVFKLVLREVERLYEGYEVQGIKKAVKQVFDFAGLERRFEEIASITKSVTSAGYRRESAYYSIYFSMLIIDVEMASGSE